MRTTVTLDADTERIVRQRMVERGVSFKEALNGAIRDGVAGAQARRPFVIDTAHMGAPTVTLDRALALAGELEDDELARRLLAGR